MKSASEIPITVYATAILSIPKSFPLGSAPKMLITLSTIIASAAGIKGITDNFTFIILSVLCID